MAQKSIFSFFGGPKSGQANPTIKCASLSPALHCGRLTWSAAQAEGPLTHDPRGRGVAQAREPRTQRASLSKASESGGRRD